MISTWGKKLMIFLRTSKFLILLLYDCIGHLIGCGDTIRVQRWGVERGVSADGWGAMETANE